MVVDECFNVESGYLLYIYKYFHNIIIPVRSERESVDQHFSEDVSEGCGVGHVLRPHDGAEEAVLRGHQPRVRLLRVLAQHVPAHPVLATAAPLHLHSQ